MDNACIRCGRVIPEGRCVCLHCGSYDDMQTFRPQIKTNGDRIRRMNDDDIANQIAERCGMDCFQESALCEWLKSEVTA